MAKQLAFYYDSSVCTGCKSCQVACKEKYDLPVGINYRRVLAYGGGGWIFSEGVLVPHNVFAYYVSTSCQHCLNPACIHVCPTTAIQKRADGIVVINPDLCIGCRYCQWACPYGAPQFNETTGRMGKCDFCQDLLAQGESPACVATCPMRALSFGELDQINSKTGTVRGVEPLPEPELTNPSIVITPHRDAQLSGKGTGHVLNLPEEL